MNELKSKINKQYGDKIRIRACGVLIENDHILLLKHDGIGEKGFFWNCPGGEPNHLESLEMATKREFEEETDLVVSVGELLHFNEYIKKPLHAIEFYYRVRRASGEIKLGKDPESNDFQVLSEWQWFSRTDLINLPSETYPNFLAKFFNKTI